VHAFEAMKLRLLNAGHQIIANPGEILNIETISECMAHPTIRAFLRKVSLTESAPHVDAVPGMSAEAYIDLIDTRFSNPEIRDTVRRVAFDGASRHPGFVLPIIRDALAAGTDINGLALVEALWARMCEGTREDGSVIAPNDPYWDDLQAIAQAAKTNPQAWLDQARVYSGLGQSEVFATAFDRWLRVIWAEGATAAMQRYIDS
jgi:mannitol 2-dehydrogenase